MWKSNADLTTSQLPQSWLNLKINMLSEKAELQNSDCHEYTTQLVLRPWWPKFPIVCQSFSSNVWQIFLSKPKYKMKCRLRPKSELLGIKFVLPWPQSSSWVHFWWQRAAMHQRGDAPRSPSFISTCPPPSPPTKCKPQNPPQNPRQLQFLYNPHFFSPRMSFAPRKTTLRWRWNCLQS